MAQSSTHFAPVAPSYITPITCPNCTANAHLIRRARAITGGATGEIRTFECPECTQLTEMFIRD